jgi:hypothetical protein
VRHLTFTRKAGQTAAVLAVGALTLTFGATAAFADTSAATAQALDLSLAGGSLVTSGSPQTASNPGGTGTVTSGSQPSLAVLGTQATVGAGVLVQTAVANGDGTSAACAGLVGPGGSIQIGSSGACTVVGAAAGGITLHLPGLVTLTATAILEECTASSSGTLTAQAELVDASVNLVGSPAVSIPVNPAAGSSVSAFLLSLGLNTQSTPQAGVIKGTALSLSVLGVVGLDVGTVTCGPNAVTSVSSVFPVKSLPIAGGTAAVLGSAGVLWYRRRRRSFAS